MMAAGAGEGRVYLNGEYMDISEARIPVLDRGFIFGDGIYEVVPAYGGKPFRMGEHLDRLARSLATVRIASPLTRQQWDEVVRELIASSPWPDCTVYLQITRGVAPRNHAFPPADTVPTVFGMVSPMHRPDAAAREQGVAVISLPDERWLHCHIKSVSLLGNILARQAAVEAGVEEAVLFRDGMLTEGAASNIWVVKDGVLMAPPRNHLILEGIRYGLMMELARERGVEFVTRPITRDEVFSADELLITSASKEVLPILRLDDQPVGSGRPGPVYAALRAGYDERIAAL